MKRISIVFLFLVLTSLFTCLVFRTNAQSSFYGGFVVGALSDRNHFQGDNGQSITGGGVSGLLGMQLGFEHDGFFFSTGFNRQRLGVRVFELDRSVGRFSTEMEVFSFTENFIIPLTVAKEVKVIGGWDLRIGVGLLGIISRDSGSEQMAGLYPLDGNQQGLQPALTADSTLISWTSDRKFNFGFETSVQIVYRTGGRIDFFAVTAFQAHFFPLFEASFQYYSEGPVRNGVSTGVNSLVFGIGMNYAFLKIGKANREL